MKNILLVFCCFFALISCNKNNDAPVNTPVDSLKIRLIAYYPFNNNTKDESGNHYDLSPHGVLPDTDRFGNAGKAYYFDGNIGRMDIPVLAKADSLREFTISFWVKTNEARGNILSFLPHDRGPLSPSFISISTNSEGSNILYSTFLIESADNPFSFGYMDSFIPFGNALGKWIHYVMIQRYNTQYLHPFYTYSHFQNNVKYDPGFEAASGYNPRPVSFNNGGSIGCEAIWQPESKIKYANYLSGNIDDIRIYSRALSDNEVLKLYELKE